MSSLTVMSVREQNIANAVSFLKNASVKTSPLAKQIAFLESKGLTKDEIREALDQATASDESSDQPPKLPPRPDNLTLSREQTTSWKDLVISFLSVVGFGYGLYASFKTIYRHYRNEMNMIHDTIKQLNDRQSSNEKMRIEVLELRGLIEQMKREKEEHMQEIIKEIRSLKAMVAGRRVAIPPSFQNIPKNSSSPGVPPWQLAKDDSVQGNLSDLEDRQVFNTESSKDNSYEGEFLPKVGDDNSQLNDEPPI